MKITKIRNLTSKFMNDSIYYLDRLSSEPVWIPKSKLIKYVESTYMMDSHTYFDLCMSKLSDKYNKCVVCGKPTKFINIFNGYRLTCSCNCRNLLISKGNLELLVVTKSGLVTHVVNQDYLTKYLVPIEVQRKLSDKLRLIDLINFLDESNCMWISGINSKSINFVSTELRNLRLKIKL